MTAMTPGLPVRSGLGAIASPVEEPPPAEDAEPPSGERALTLTLRAEGQVHPGLAAHGVAPQGHAPASDTSGLQEVRREVTDQAIAVGGK